MKTRSCCVVLGVMWVCSSWAQLRSEAQMSEIMRLSASKMNIAEMTMQTKSSVLFNEVEPEHEAFVVYASPAKKGFVVVSADERLPEVLALSEEDEWDAESVQNEGLMALLQSYVVAHQLIAEGTVTAEEVFGTTEDVARTAIMRAGSLLKQITFSQKYPYNEKCPIIDGKHAPSGCVPTGMAMVMKYYGYPNTGKGSVSYTKNGIKISYDFSTLDIDWDKIFDFYSEAKDLSSQTFTPQTERVFGFKSDGGISYNESKARKLELVKLYNYSTDTVSGKVQFIVENADKTIRQLASAAVEVSNIKPNYGWKSFYLTPSLSNTLPDGTYRLYVGFTEDGKNYTYAKTSKTSTTDYYIEVTKTGRTFVADEAEFVCTASEEEVEDISTLLQACGAASKAGYTASSTGAVTKEMCKALNTYFNYDTDLYHGDNIASTTAKKEITNAITKGYPIVVSGRTEPDEESENGSGHCFIMDGFDYTGNSPMYHINWGWNGSSNGYFLLTQMQPSEAGTGGSTKNYSYDYDLFFNVHPEDSVDEGRVLKCDSLVTDTTVVSPNDKFKVTVYALSNAKLLKKQDGPINLYFVNKAGESFLAGKVRNGGISAGATLENFRVTLTVPTEGIPEGDYQLLLGTTEMAETDRFICPSVSTIHVNSVPVGIHGQKVATDDAECYDLAGRKMEGSAHGIVIKNGQKILK